MAIKTAGVSGEILLVSVRARMLSENELPSNKVMGFRNSYVPTTVPATLRMEPDRTLCGGNVTIMTAASLGFHRSGIRVNPKNTNDLLQRISTGGGSTPLLLVLGLSDTSKEACHSLTCD